MLFFAIFTIGFIVGVSTALWIFPPNVKEIEEQEVDALAPILRVKEQKQRSTESEELSKQGILASN